MTNDELMQLKARALEISTDGGNWTMEIGSKPLLALIAKVESLAADAERLDLMIRHGSSNGQFIWIEQKSHFIDPRGRIAGIGDDQRSALDAAMAKEKA